MTVRQEKFDMGNAEDTSGNPVETIIKTVPRSKKGNRNGAMRQEIGILFTVKLRAQVRKYKRQEERIICTKTSW